MSGEGLVNKNKADEMEPSPATATSTTTNINNNENDHYNPEEPTSQPNAATTTSTCSPLNIDGGTGIAQGDIFEDEGKGEGDYYHIDEQHGLVPPKRSHVCCGCCCDTRQATIAVNIVNLSLSLFGIYTILLQAVNAGTGLPGKPVLVLILGMLCNGLGLYGGFAYHRLATLLCGSWFIAEGILRIVHLNVPGFILCVCFAYPHFVFYSELERGIMTPANYDRERQCCTCCN